MLAAYFLGLVMFKAREYFESFIAVTVFWLWVVYSYVFKRKGVWPPE